MQLAYTGPQQTPAATPLRDHVPAPGRSDGRGLDLEVHYPDVRAAVFSACSLTCEHYNIDPEDLVGIVCESVLLSNGRPSAYDPTRASVTRFLRTLAVSRLLHLVDKIRRRRRTEQVGMRVAGADPFRGTDADAATANVGISLCPDVRASVKRILPFVLSRAQDADEEARATAPARATPSTGREQGWREQAVQWVVLDSPSSAAAAGWWKCTVREATARLLWARDEWSKAVADRLVSFT